MESIVKKMMSDNEKADEMNMCKALGDLYNDRIEQGIERDRNELIYEEGY